MKTKTAEITLRSFERSDFKRLISWVPTPEALGQWCGPFFGYPLDESKLQRRLSRVLVAPDRRRLGIGGGMVCRASAFSFDTHHVDRIDLGVDADNVAAITCYRRQGFKHVGTWPHAMEAGPTTIDVYWMTLSRAAWVSRSAAGDIC